MNNPDQHRSISPQHKVSSPPPPSNQQQSHPQILSHLNHLQPQSLINHIQSQMQPLLQPHIQPHIQSHTQPQMHPPNGVRDSFYYTYPNGVDPKLALSNSYHAAYTNQVQYLTQEQPLPQPQLQGQQQHQPQLQLPLLQLQQKYQEPQPPPPPSLLQQQLQIKHQEPLSESRNRLPSSNQYVRLDKKYPRKRALTASDGCRLKKVKCDNVRPMCGSCIKGGLSSCNYRSDDSRNDYSKFDPASLAILTKLDTILRDLNDLKRTNGSNQESQIQKLSDLEPIFNKESSTVPSNFANVIDSLIWDMSITSIFNWDSFKQLINVDQAEINKSIHRLINDYNSTEPLVLNELSFKNKIAMFESIEKLLETSFPILINSFFLNSHTKIPVLDTLEIMESIECYRILKSHDNSLTFTSILQLYVERDNNEGSRKLDEEKIKVPDQFLQALRLANIKDEPFRRKALISFFKTVPHIILMCAIGALAVPVQLRNMDNFASSLEERESLSIGCLGNLEPPENIPRSRFKIAHLLAEYSKIVSILYPYTSKVGSLQKIEYGLLRSQYELYIMSPLLAQRSITEACQNMTYYLQANRIDFSKDSLTDDTTETKKNRPIRLFWCCLKLESELGTELSPFVTLSGITFIKPPAIFPTIPQNMEEPHSESARRLASNYEDSYSWFFYLTEIAVRQIDNCLFDDIFSLSATNNKLWDQPEFYDDLFWKTAIKYTNQYNGVINSLSPRIRNFVFHESDAEQVYKGLKRLWEKDSEARSHNRSDVLDQLEDFLIDDDILLRSQSECVIFIKTRIITSKLHLLRPLVYLIIHDRIPLVELLQAAMSAFQEIELKEKTETKPATSFDSPCFTSCTLSSGFEDYETFPDQQAPQFYQREYPEEDFSDLIEETDDNSDISLKDISLARIKILKFFFITGVSLPKLNIPKLSGHRHPGSWFVIRNTFIANILQVLLYKKVEQYVEFISNDEKLSEIIGKLNNNSSSETIGQMFAKLTSKQIIRAMLQHSLHVFKYWQDEMADCKVYIEYCEKLLQLI